MLPKRGAGARPGCRGLSGGREPHCSADSSRAREPCRAGNRSKTADTGRREQQQRDRQRGIARGPAGGGTWPWDGGGHHFSFLGQKWQVGWCDRKAHPPAWKLVITWMAPAGGGGRRGRWGRAWWHVLPLGQVQPPSELAGRRGGPGMSSQSPVTCPTACQLMGAACREPQLTDAPAASPGLLAQQRVPPSPGTHTGLHVADRTYMPCSPEGPGSVHASRAPSRPCRAPCLPASQCPRSASSLSLSLFLFLLFFLSPSCRRRGRRGRKGMLEVNGRQEGMPEGPGASLLCLSGNGWVLILLPQLLPEKSLPSLPPLFVSCHKGGEDGLRARWGACPLWGGEQCCAWDCVLVPAPAAQSREVMLPGGPGTPGPLPAWTKPSLPLLPCVTSGTCCDTQGWVAWPRLWSRW
ncbi:uncharacterized protein ACIBXB_001109 [Morphnus guianensis]